MNHCPCCHVVKAGNTVSSFKKENHKALGWLSRGFLSPLCAPSFSVLSVLYAAWNKTFTASRRQWVALTCHLRPLILPQAFPIYLPTPLLCLVYLHQLSSCIHSTNNQLFHNSAPGISVRLKQAPSAAALPLRPQTHKGTNKRLSGHDEGWTVIAPVLQGTVVGSGKASGYQEGLAMGPHSGNT